MTSQSSAEDIIAKQDRQYKFPYHWLPNMTDMGVVAGRSMQWTLEYFGYMIEVANEIHSRLDLLSAESVIDIDCGDGRLGPF